MGMCPHSLIIADLTFFIFFSKIPTKDCWLSWCWILFAPVWNMQSHGAHPFQGGDYLAGLAILRHIGLFMLSIDMPDSTFYTPHTFFRKKDYA
jgi:hypothetical protein